MAPRSTELYLGLQLHDTCRPILGGPIEDAAMIATDKYTGLSAAQARELLAYDPDTGILTWKVTRSIRVRQGAPAGHCRPHGYSYVCVNRGQYPSHWLAWLIHYGEWPATELDHINGQRSDNRISNLRTVSRKQNQNNQRRAHSRNKLGVLGVSYCEKWHKYTASIGHNRKKIYLGGFNTIEEAHNAYLKAKRELHEGNTI